MLGILWVGHRLCYTLSIRLSIFIQLLVYIFLRSCHDRSTSMPVFCRTELAVFLYFQDCGIPIARCSPPSCSFEHLTRRDAKNGPCTCRQCLSQSLFQSSVLDFVEDPSFTERA